MQQRHGPRPDATAESIPNDQVVTLPEPLDERPKAQEIVAVICVCEDDVASSCRRDPTSKRAAVTALLNRDHTRAQLPGNLLRTVGAAIVRDDQFAQRVRSEAAFFRKAMELRTELHSPNPQRALLLLLDCFGLVRGEAAEVLRNLQRRRRT